MSKPITVEGTKRGWWELKATMFDDSEITESDQEHIADMVKQGYMSGDLIHEEDEWKPVSFW